MSQLPRFTTHYYKVMDRLREDIPRWYAHRPKTELLLNTYLRLMEEMENRNATDQEIKWALYHTGTSEPNDPRFYLMEVGHYWRQHKYREDAPTGYHCPDLSTPIETHQGTLTVEPWPTGQAISFASDNGAQWVAHPPYFGGMYQILLENGRFVADFHYNSCPSLIVANDAHLTLPAGAGMQLIHITPTGKSQLLQVFADVANRPEAEW